MPRNPVLERQRRREIEDQQRRRGELARAGIRQTTEGFKAKDKDKGELARAGIRRTIAGFKAMPLPKKKKKKDEKDVVISPQLRRYQPTEKVPSAEVIAKLEKKEQELQPTAEKFKADKARQERERSSQIAKLTPYARRI